MSDTKTIIIEFESNIAQFERELAKLDKGTKEYDKTVDDLAETQEEYDKALIESAKNMQIFGTSLNDVKGLFKGVQAGIRVTIRSLGALKAAIIATGIGAVLIAWQAFNVAMQSSKRLQDELRVTGAGLNNVWDAMTGAVSDVVENMLGLNKELEEGEEGLTGINKALAFVITGLEKAGFVAVGTAGTFAGLAKQGEENEKALIAQEDSLNKYNLEVAKAELVIEKLIQSTRELTSTEEENLKSIKEAIKLFDELAIVQEARLQKDIDTQRSIAETASGTALQFEEEEKLLILERELLQFQIRSSSQRRELLLRETDATRQLAAAKKDAGIPTGGEDPNQFNAELQAELDAQIAFDAAITALSDQLTADLKADSDEILANQQAFNIASANLDDAKAKKKKADEEQAAEDTVAAAATAAGALASIAGENTIAGKAFAITQATINTWSAANAVLNSPLPLTATQRFIQMAAIIAVGLANVQRIVGTPLPKVQTTEGRFAKGGYISGRSHSMGGVHIEAEGGEAIINKRSMSMPGVRDAASYLNQLGGGLKFQTGGLVPSSLRTDTSQIIDAINLAGAATRTVLVTEDLDTVQNRVTVTEDRATL